jgi:hypothetical protein
VYITMGVHYEYLPGSDGHYVRDQITPFPHGVVCVLQWDASKFLSSTQHRTRRTKYYTSTDTRFVCMSPHVFPTALQLRAVSIPTGNQLGRGGLLGLQLGAAAPPAPAALLQPMASVLAVSMPASLQQQQQDATVVRLQNLTAQLTYVQAEFERLRSAVGVTLAPEVNTVLSGCW